MHSHPYDSWSCGGSTVRRRGAASASLRATLAAVAVACVLVAGRPVLAQDGQARPPTPVQAETVSVEPVVDTIHAVGTLQAEQSIVVRPEIAGVVTKVHFDESSRVTAGDSLFTLDDSIYRAELRQALASLTLSEHNYERAVELYEKGAATARARDEAVADLDVDRAAVALARARLGKTVIKAPFGGVAGLTQVDLGAYVFVGQDMVSLDDIDPVKIDFDVPERYLRFLSPDQSVRVEVDALPGRTFEGTIYAISPRADPEGRSIAVRAHVPNPDGTLKPGLFARVSVIVDERADAIVIPEQAIVPRGDRLFVFRIVDGAAALTPVRVGLRRYGRAEIVEGLGEADVVVTAGQLKIGDGSPVSIVEPGNGDG